MTEIKLKWRIRSARKGEKIYSVYYISVPAKVAQFLTKYDPVLDPENQVILFKPKQKDR